MSFERDLEEMIKRNIATIREEMAGLRADVQQLKERLPPLKPMTVSDAAHHFGVHAATIRRQIKAGRLPVCYVGRSVRVDVARVKSFDGDDVRAELQARGL